MAEDLEAWLSARGLARHAEDFAARRIDLETLALCDDDDLRELGLALGDFVRLRAAVRELRAAAAPAPPAPEPPAVAAPGARAPGVAGGELRLASVLFIDLVNSTRFARGLDLEAQRDFHLAFQTVVRREVEATGGSVMQMQGDGALACFGWPRALEDGAQRAVTSAAAVLAGLPASPLDGAPVEARAGIATGEVLVGDIDADWTALDGALLGEAPSLAARMQAVATPGGIVVCGQTRELLGGAFDAAALPGAVLKGFEGDTEAWRIEGPRRRVARFEARRGDELSPFAGRGGELALLAACWSAAEAGEAQVALIQGDAGIGKSRLVREALAAIPREGVRRMRYQCLPGCESSPLHPITGFLRRSAREGDGAARTEREILTAAVREAELPEADAAAILDGLAPEGPADGAAPGADAPAEPAPEAAGEPRRLIRGLARFFAHVSARERLVVVVEDLQWADPSTLELLGEMARAAGDGEHAMMMVLTARDGALPIDPGLTRVTALRLPGMDRAAARSLARRALGPAADGPRGEAIVEAIVKRTDGVPLFVEELARAAAAAGVAAASGAAAGDPAAPAALSASLRELLEARIDAAGAPRDIVALAAALVQEIEPTLLAEAADRPTEAVEAALDAMLRGGLLAPAGRGEGPPYVFRHALLRDAAYNSMLAGQRREAHRAVAAALERLNPDLAAREPEGLALHVAAAGEPRRARDLWRAAAQGALELGAGAEAVTRQEAALAQNALLPADAETLAAEIELRREMRLPLERHFWGSPRLVENLERLLALEEGREDGLAGFELVHGLFGRALIAGDVDGADRFLTMMERLAGRHGDPVMQAMTLHKAGMRAFQAGEFDEAARSFAECLAFRDRVPLATVRRFYAPDPWAVALAMAAWARAMDGRRAEAADLARQAEEAADAGDDPFTAAYVHGVLSTTAVALDDPEGARRHADRVVRIDADRSMPYWRGWSNVARAWAVAAGGDAKTAVPLATEAVAAYADTGAKQLLPYAHVVKAEIELAAGRPRAAERTLAALAALDAELSVRFHRARGDAVRAATARALEGGSAPSGEDPAAPARAAQ